LKLIYDGALPNFAFNFNLRRCTWGLAITRKVTVIRAVFYTGAQMAGAYCGTLLAQSLSKAEFDEAGGGVNGQQAGGRASLFAHSVPVYPWRRRMCRVRETRQRV